MSRAVIPKAQIHAVRELPLDDAAILQGGHEALRGRLGTVGLLRFLMLVGGGRTRYEDARKTWIGTSLDDFELWLGNSKKTRVSRVPS